MDFRKAQPHVGHKVEVVSYGVGQNIAIECVQCMEVIVDAEGIDTRSVMKVADLAGFLHHDTEGNEKRERLPVAARMTDESFRLVVGMTWYDEGGFLFLDVDDEAFHME